MFKTNKTDKKNKKTKKTKKSNNALKGGKLIVTENKKLQKKGFKKLNKHILSTMLEKKESPFPKKYLKQPEPLLPLREKMLQQLKSSRFRFINEQLYNSDSSESLKYFQKNPDSFTAYHEGYKAQMKQWPLNPVDLIIESIEKMPVSVVVADFGCGDAKLAASVSQKVHSFDLVAVHDKVTACDMSHTNLLSGIIDIAVFCLSLMGTNTKDYLLEANRVMKKGGTLKIAEVASRFNKVRDFVKYVEKLGFQLILNDLSNNLFYFMDFKKTENKSSKDVSNISSYILKPCLYKKR